MTKLLIDTNILIDHLRGDPQASVLLQDVAAGRVRASISIITEAELLAWPALRPGDIRAMDALLAMFPKIAVTSRVARTAAQLRRAYPIEIPDALIAATAMLAHATLVTRNTKHFAPLRGLHLRSL